MSDQTTATAPNPESSREPPGSYWVIGGEYATTDFEHIAGGGDEDRFGPFASYPDARAKWAELSMNAVDNALVRYRIEQPRASAYWVVGGTYTTMDFTTVAEGGAEERIGPFATYQDALDAWRGKAWDTVDDGFVRYRIEQR